MDQNDTIFGLLLAATMLAVLIVNTWNSAPVATTAATTPSTASATSVTETHEPLTATKQDNAMSDIVNITVTTNLGAIELELYTDKAPLTVANFVAYAEAGFYAGTIFHRVIEGFMIQGGGFNEEFDQKPTNDPVKNEADNGLTNDYGTIAMARTSDPQSATAQFFINVADNNFLNFRSADASGYGYAVFGKVVGGDAVVEKIKSVATGSGGPMPTDVPKEPVIIESVTVTP